MPKPTNLKFFLSGDKVNSLTLSTSIISDSENTWCPATSHYRGMLPPSVHCALTWYAFPRQQRNIKLKALQISRFDSPSGKVDGGTCHLQWQPPDLWQTIRQVQAVCSSLEHSNNKCGIPSAGTSPSAGSLLSFSSFLSRMPS